MMIEKTWEQILEEAQPMEVKKITNNSPSLPKVRFKDNDDSRSDDETISE